jgi:EAL domain-containing protein (putative c-di-GMP-specific phosphodiesterase class I)/ActR/RegA family two-component response regulator
VTAIRVLIGEDDASFRGALMDLLGSDPAFELVGAAVDAEETIALARSLGPDVVLLDVKMPAGGGPTAARAIRASCPNTKTLALTAYHDRATMMEMLRAGAAGYLVKGASVDEILDAIVRTAAGKPSLSSDAAGTLLREMSSLLESEEREAEDGRRHSALIDEFLAGRGMSMEFQPIVDIRDGVVAGTEALARFAFEPSPAIRDPAAWFAEARRLGYGPDLELAAAALALERMSELGPDQFLCINVSPDTAATGRLLDLVSGASPDRVVLELTERAAEGDIRDLLSALEALRSLGVRLAVDDMGTGAASLRQILWLQPQFLKLDIWLTQGLESGPSAKALAGALIHFAADIGATVIAEGIETTEQVEALRALGVVYGQGFLLAPPDWPPAALPRTFPGGLDTEPTGGATNAHSRRISIAEQHGRIILS